jgi:hypothetical protein
MKNLTNALIQAFAISRYHSTLAAIISNNARKTPPPMQSKEPTIDQMNEVIAVFDGWKLLKGNPELICPSCDEGRVPSMCCTCDQKNDKFQKAGKMVARTYFGYHASWDVLMPVVKKIPKLIHGTDELDLRRQLSSRWKPIQNELCNVDLRNVHFCVYKFIEWYNQNKPNAE